MALHRALLLLGLVGCIDAANDTDLAETDAVVLTGDSAADGPTWEAAETLHGNAHLFDAAGANARRVHSLWIDGSDASPVTLTIAAHANAEHDVRIAVLGPDVNGTRPVLGAGGYAAATGDVSLTLPFTTSGEHLVVVGSYNLASDTFYDLSATCTDCEDRVDVLATPKDFSLVGDEHGMLSVQLGSVMQSFNADVSVEVWASAPMQSWNATKVATSEASGSQVNVIVPDAVKAGDDLRLVVRQGEGRVLDSGITVRYMPARGSLVRLDNILYDDIVGMRISGIVGYFEGQADLRLHSETRKKEIAQSLHTVDHPGQVGNGLNAFDAHFTPELGNAAHDGELLSVGFINGNGDYSRMGCFEYCNNLSGMSACTGGARTCP
jgi:hypothetical protein